MKKSILTAAVVAASSAPVAAQTTDTAQLVPSLETPRLETVVVVSSRREMPLRQVATSVAAMDEAQIEARGFSAMADVLRAMPSVSVSNSGGMGKATSLRVRGEARFRTLVQIDGVDVSDPTDLQASAPIQHILSSNVSRVELLRGPQGMMYGADAGGVLNISTRSTGEDMEARIAAEGGSFGSQRYSASLGGGRETVDYFVSATRADTDGFNSSLNDKELRDDDGYKNTTLHARGGWNISDSLRLEAVARDTEASNEFDRCGFPAVDDCTGDFNQTNARVSMAHKTGVLENQLAYSRTEIARKNFAGGAVSYDTEGEIEKLNLTGRADLSDVHALVYGLEQREDSVGELERDQWALYAEYQGNYADTFYLTAGVRRDDNDDFGHHDSLRLSGAYLIDAVAAGSLKLKTSYGTGFRAPSLFEIDYNHSSPYSAELAALSPEESEGIDVGVEYFGDHGLHLEAVLFDQRIEHEIGFDLVGFTGYIQSGGESRSRGVELIADAPLTDTLVLNTNYTYTDAEDAADAPRARMPEHMANIGLTYVPMDALSASLNLRAARGAVDTSGEAQDNYQVLDASLRYTLNPSVTVYLRGENLTDKSYVEVSGYRTAGASGYAGVEVTF